MKTMSLTKIALALLVSIPALSLNGAAVTATAAPSLWKSLCSKTQALTSRAVSGIGSGVRAGFVRAQNFVANHKVAAQYSAAASLTGLAAFGAFKGYKWYKAYKARIALINQPELYSKEELANKAKIENTQFEDLEQRQAVATNAQEQQAQAKKQEKEAAQRKLDKEALGL